MRKYFFVTGVIAFISFLISLIFLTKLHIPYYVYSIDLTFLNYVYLIELIFTICFLLYYFYVNRISNRILKGFLSFVLFISSIPINLCFIAAIVLITVNINFKPLKEEVVHLKIGTKQQEENYHKINKILDSFNNQIAKYSGNESLHEKLNSFDYNNANIKKALAATKNQRNELMEFLSNNTISVPNSFENSESKDGKLPEYYLHISPLNTFIKLELVDIKRMINDNNYREGINRYLSLWRVVDKLYDTKNIAAIECTALNSILNRMIDFHSSNQAQINPSDIRGLSHTMMSIDKKIDELYVTAYSKEFLYRKDALLRQDSKEYIWPLFDYKRTLNMEYDVYNYQIGEINKPFYNRENIYESIKSYPELEKLIKPRNMLENNIINPIGKFFVSLSVVGNSFVDPISMKEIIKSKLKALSYILERRNEIAIPIDNLTGKKFIVKEFKDFYEISTEYKNGGKPAFVYKVKNNN